MRMPALFARCAPRFARGIDSRVRRKIELAVAFAIGLATSLVVISFSPGGGAGGLAFHRSAHAHAPVHAPMPAVTRLDLLRREAADGDPLSSRDLTNALLDRYDLAADPQDLFEAVVWVDRQWALSGSADAAPRIVSRYCDQRVLSWHWLCISGE